MGSTLITGFYSEDLSECTAASSLCSGPFTQSLGPRLYVMGSQSGVAVYETDLGSMPPTQAPTDSPTEPMFTFITSGKCEAAGFHRITDSTTCQLAAETLGTSTWLLAPHQIDFEDGIVSRSRCIQHQIMQGALEAVVIELNNILHF